MPNEPSTLSRPSGSLPQGIRVASILSFACGIIIGLVTIRFVVAGFQEDNPLAGVALVYGLPAFAYCLAGYYLRKRRRGGRWLAVLTAALWSVPLWAYDGEPGFLWTGWSSYFLPANLAIILLVVVNRRARSLSDERGGA